MSADLVQSQPAALTAPWRSATEARDTEQVTSGGSRLLARLAIAAILLGGIALTLLVFWPGIMTYDATFVYGAISDARPGDWQSPVMTAVWALIDPLAPGATSMFLLIATLYWLGFGILSFAIVRRSPVLAIILPLLALTPPAFLLAGVIWRDVLLADAWLVAAALTYATALKPPNIRIPSLVIGLVLVTFGFLMRPNALFAAPILAAYVIWPTFFAWRRMLVLYIPAVIAFYGLQQVAFYTILNAQRQNILHTILVFDIGGITHFTQKNWFPVTFTENQTRLLLGVCYDPSQWDTYWRLDPCSFVMRKLEDQDIFGYPAMIDAWKKAVLANPVAYIRHRLAHMETFLFDANSTVAFHALEDPERPMYPDHFLLNQLARLDKTINQSIFFRLAFWLGLTMVVFVAGWRVRGGRAGAYALGVSASAIVYMMTFLPVGVATAYRYGYWAVLAGLTGGVLVLVARRREARLEPRKPLAIMSANAPPSVDRIATQRGQ